MIDWFTVGAQVVNFLILIAILRYFLYGRILKAIDDRRRSIEQQQTEAQRLREELQQQLDQARRANEELDRKRDEMLQAIKAELAEFRKQQEDAARRDTELLRDRWLENLRHQRDSFLRSIRVRVVEATTQISRMALQDLADVSLESRMVERLIRELENLDASARAQLKSRRPGSDAPVIVESTFELDERLRELLQAKLHELFGQLGPIRFDVSEDLDCGIAVQVDSHTLSWNLRDYLDEMDEEMRRVVDEEIASANSPSAIASGDNA